MKSFIATVFSCLCAVASLNYWVDPASLWHKPTISLSAVLPVGSCVETKDNIDERLYKTQQIQLIAKPQVVLFSSSRGFQIRSSELRGVKGFFNGAMSGAAIEDYIVVWEQLKKQNKIPEKAVVFMDDSQLYDKRPTYRWHSTRSLFYEFLSRVPVSDSEKSRLLWIEVSKRVKDFLNFGAKFADLLSFGTLKQSLKDVQQRWTSWQSGGFRVVKLEDRNPENNCWVYDGSRYYPAWEVLPKPAEEVKRVASEEAESEDMSYLHHYKIDGDAAFLFKKLFDDLARHKVSVEVYLPPYQTDGYEMFRSSLDTGQAMDTFTRAAEGLAGEFGFRFVNRVDPASLGCKSSEFMDIEHPLGACLGRIIEDLNQFLSAK